MGHWDIAKSFELDYGHRVWHQKLDEELSCGHSCVCRHLHGHRATIIVHLEGDVLDAQDMVTDFHNIGWFKKFLDSVMDHKMVLDIKDPLLPVLLPDYHEIDGVLLMKDKLIYHEEGYYTLSGW